MNMMHVLHREARPQFYDGVLPAPDFVPPTPGEVQPGGTPPRWPAAARAVVVVLVVAVVLGAIGTVIGVASRDDGSTVRELRDDVAALTVERDRAADTVRDLDAQLVTLRQRLADAEAANDSLGRDVDALGTQIDALTDLRAEALATVDDVTAQLDEALVTIDDLTTQRDKALADTRAALATADERAAELVTVRERVTALVAKRDALAALFPMKFDVSLGDVAVVGTYDVTTSQVFCAGLSTCGKARLLDDLKITKTSDGFLRAAIPGFVEGGLFRADGALHLVADSTTAVPACDGKARTARIVMTAFPGSYQIAEDGTRKIVGLDGVITVEADAVGTCPAVLAFYAAGLKSASI